MHQFGPKGGGVKSSKFKFPWFAREGRPGDVEVRVDRRIIEYYSPRSK